MLIFTDITIFNHHSNFCSSAYRLIFCHIPLLSHIKFYFLLYMLLNRLLVGLHSTIIISRHQDTISLLDYCYTHNHNSNLCFTKNIALKIITICTSMSSSKSTKVCITRHCETTSKPTNFLPRQSTCLPTSIAKCWCFVKPIAIN